VEQELVARGVDAGELIREIARHIGGGGGGKPTLAEAGGKSPDKLPEALDYGAARTGVAVSDPSGTLARPVGVVRRIRTDAGMRELLALIRDEEPEQV